MLTYFLQPACLCPHSLPRRHPLSTRCPPYRIASAASPILQRAQQAPPKQPASSSRSNQVRIGTSTFIHISHDYTDRSRSISWPRTYGTAGRSLRLPSVRLPRLTGSSSQWAASAGATGPFHRLCTAPHSITRVGHVCVAISPTAPQGSLPSHQGLLWPPTFYVCLHAGQ